MFSIAGVYCHYFYMLCTFNSKQLEADKRKSPRQVALGNKMDGISRLTSQNQKKEHKCCEGVGEVHQSSMWLKVYSSKRRLSHYTFAI